MLTEIVNYCELVYFVDRGPVVGVESKEDQTKDKTLQGTTTKVK